MIVTSDCEGNLDINLLGYKCVLEQLSNICIATCHRIERHDHIYIYCPSIGDSVQEVCVLNNSIMKRQTVQYLCFYLHENVPTHLPLP